MALRRVIARIRLLRAELLVLGGSIVFALLFAEAALRLHYVVTYTGTIEDLNVDIPPVGHDALLGDMLALSPSERLVYVMKPGLDVQFRGSRVRTNTLGFRERTPPSPKPPGGARIIGIGDSVMFGLGVEESERYMDVIETELASSYPSLNWESITLAAPGYNLVTALEALERHGMIYEPYLVIFGLFYNDFCLPNFVGRRLPVWSTDSFIAHYLKPHEEVAAMLMHREDLTRDHGGISPAELLARDREAFQDAYCNEQNILPRYRHLVGRESFDRALDRLAEIGRQRDIPIVFLSYGGARPVDTDDLPMPDGVELVDLNPLYRDYLRAQDYRRVKESDLVLSVDDVHPSVQGHRLIAAGLVEHLQSSGVLDTIIERTGKTS